MNNNIKLPFMFYNYYRKISCNKLQTSNDAAVLKYNITALFLNGLKKISSRVRLHDIISFDAYDIVHCITSRRRYSGPRVCSWFARGAGTVILFVRAEDNGEIRVMEKKNQKQNGSKARDFEGVRGGGGGDKPRAQFKKRRQAKVVENLFSFNGSQVKLYDGGVATSTDGRLQQHSTVSRCDLTPINYNKRLFAAVRSSPNTSTRFKAAECCKLYPGDVSPPRRFQSRSSTPRRRYLYMCAHYTL